MLNEFFLCLRELLFHADFVGFIVLAFIDIDFSEFRCVHIIFMQHKVVQNLAETRFVVRFENGWLLLMHWQSNSWCLGGAVSRCALAQQVGLDLAHEKGEVDWAAGGAKREGGVFLNTQLPFAIV